MTTLNYWGRLRAVFAPLPFDCQERHAAEHDALITLCTFMDYAAANTGVTREVLRDTMETTISNARKRVEEQLRTAQSRVHAEGASDCGHWTGTRTASQDEVTCHLCLATIEGHRQGAEFLAALHARQTTRARADGNVRRALTEADALAQPAARGLACGVCNGTGLISGAAAFLSCPECEGCGLAACGC